MGDGGWSTNSWSKYKKELEDCFRTITQLGYALVCISHDQDKTFKRKDGTEYNQIVPTAQKSLNNIVRDMADLYLYATIDEQTKQRKLVIRSLDGTVDCGSRFKYIINEVPLDYDALVEALNDAINKEAEEHGNAFVTNEKITPIIEQNQYDYDALIGEFETVVGELMNKDPVYYAPRITAIVDKYLGRGRKVADTTPNQAEFISLIVNEIRDNLMKG